MRNRCRTCQSRSPSEPRFTADFADQARLLGPLQVELLDFEGLDKARSLCRDQSGCSCSSISLILRLFVSPSEFSVGYPFPRCLLFCWMVLAAGLHRIMHCFGLSAVAAAAAEAAATGIYICCLNWLICKWSPFVDFPTRGCLFFRDRPPFHASNSAPGLGLRRRAGGLGLRLLPGPAEGAGGVPRVSPFAVRVLLGEFFEPAFGLI